MQEMPNKILVINTIPILILGILIHFSDFKNSFFHLIV